MMLSDTLPAMRAIDVVPVPGEDGRPQFVLHDQSGLTETTLAISLPGYFVLVHLNGRNSIADVQASFARQFGAELPIEQIRQLIATLDNALLLDNPRSAAAYEAARDAYRGAPIRDNTARWPDAAGLRAEIEPLFAGPTTFAGPAPRGIIAPHLDYPRGAPCYREAYAALAQSGPADRYVILGTNHFGRSTATVATTKTFRTPLGDVPVDRDFIGAIEARLERSICDGEYDHAREHSVELQVHILQILNDGRPFTIVPVLCPDPSGATGTRPALDDGPDLDDFCAAVAAELDGADGRTVLIASADLSHIGLRFGDESPATQEYLDQVGRSDQELLARLEVREENGFVAAVRATENQTRICSVGCIYALMRVLPGLRCDVLRYHQANDWPAETHVTCCAAVVY